MHIIFRFKKTFQGTSLNTELNSLLKNTKVIYSNAFAL